MSQKWQITIGLLVLTLLTFGRIVDNDLIDLDDDIYITKNPNVLAGLTWDSVGWAWTTFHAGLWLPLTWHSLQLDVQLFGNQAWGFHLTNLLLHAANVVLLFWVLSAMTGKPANSAVVAALFTVHPLHVESVAWAAERKDVLSTFFWILTMAAYLHYVRRPSVARYMLVVGGLMLGLLAKPMLVTLPFVLLLLDYWPLQRWPTRAPGTEVDMSETSAAAERASATWLILEKIPLLLLSLAASVVTMMAQRQSGAVVSLEQLSIPIRLGHAVESYGWYLEKTLLPWDLGVIYSHSYTSVATSSVVMGATLLLGLSTLAVWAARRQPAWLVGWLWFLGALLPVIGLVQAGEQAYADRFAYVPHIGLFVFLVWALDAATVAWRWPQSIRAALAGATIIALAILACIQAGHWSDTIALWEHTVAVTEMNHRAHANLGTAYVHLGDLDKARAHLGASLDILPESPEIQYNLGYVLLQRGELQAAAEHLEYAVRLRRNYAEAHQNLGLVYVLLGQSAPAVKHARRAVELQPEEPGAHLNLGLAYATAHKSELAASAFERALSLNPNYAEAHNQLGKVRLRQRRLSDAATHFLKALQLRTDYADAHHNLGIVRARQVRWPEAVQELRTAAASQSGNASYQRYWAYALYQSEFPGQAADVYRQSFRLEPNWPKTLAAKAERLATHAQDDIRDVDQALELARQACQATEFKRPELLDTLAICLAEAGQFHEAVQTARQALEQAGEQMELVRRIREHLNLFEAKRTVPRSHDEP